MNLLKESKRWHDDATVLVESSKIIELLEKFGKVTPTGSYVYDLMLDSDIDFFVSTEKPTRKLADEMTIALINNGWWNSIMFCDWSTNVPARPYFCIKQDFRGHRWKVDILMVSPSELAEMLPPRELYSRYSDAQKEQILELKVARRDGLLPEDIETVVIYDAVLKNDVQGVDSFKRYLEKQE
ncbi:MAG: nucleotidyltransferase domain-containing protein [Patescibacteria group bacterium]